MNRNILIIILITSTIFSCNNSDEDFTVTNEVVGKWKEIYADGGFTGKKIHVHPDSVIVLMLNKDRTYQQIRNGQIKKTGVYEIDIQKSENLIKYDDSTLWQTITVTNDSLYLSDNFPDGYSTVFKKN